jgi:hypothetical protein
MLILGKFIHRVIVKKAEDLKKYPNFSRDANPVRDRSFTKIGNSDEFVIEWDSWDYRSSSEKQLLTSWGYFNCGPSAIVPCGVNQDYSRKDGDPATIMSAKKRWIQSSGTHKYIASVKDINKTEDFYSDLDVSI